MPTSAQTIVFSSFASLYRLGLQNSVVDSKINKSIEDFISSLETTANDEVTLQHLKKLKEACEEKEVNEIVSNVSVQGNDPQLQSLAKLLNKPNGFIQQLKLFANNVGFLKILKDALLAFKQENLTKTLKTLLQEEVNKQNKEIAEIADPMLKTLPIKIVADEKGNKSIVVRKREILRSLKEVTTLTVYHIPPTLFDNLAALYEMFESRNLRHVADGAEIIPGLSSNLSDLLRSFGDDKLINNGRAKLQILASLIHTHQAWLLRFSVGNSALSFAIHYFAGFHELINKNAGHKETNVNFLYAEMKKQVVVASTVVEEATTLTGKIFIAIKQQADKIHEKISREQKGDHRRTVAHIVAGAEHRPYINCDEDGGESYLIFNPFDPASLAQLGNQQNEKRMADHYEQVVAAFQARGTLLSKELKQFPHAEGNVTLMSRVEEIKINDRAKRAKCTIFCICYKELQAQRFEDGAVGAKNFSAQEIAERKRRSALTAINHGFAKARENNFAEDYMSIASTVDVCGVFGIKPEAINGLAEVIEQKLPKAEIQELLLREFPDEWTKLNQRGAKNYTQRLLKHSGSTILPLVQAIESAHWLALLSRQPRATALASLSLNKG